MRPGNPWLHSCVTCSWNRWNPTFSELCENGQNLCSPKSPTCHVCIPFWYFPLELFVKYASSCGPFWLDPVLLIETSDNGPSVTSLWSWSLYHCSHLLDTTIHSASHVESPNQGTIFMAGVWTCFNHSPRFWSCWWNSLDHWIPTPKFHQQLHHNCWFWSFNHHILWHWIIGLHPTLITFSSARSLGIMAAAGPTAASPPVRPGSRFLIYTDWCVMMCVVYIYIVYVQIYYITYIVYLCLY